MDVKDGRTQAWLVLAACALLSLVILILGWRAMELTFDHWGRDLERRAHDRRDAGAAPPLPAPPPRVDLSRAGVAPSISGNPGAYFGASAYPRSAIRAGEQGRTVASLAILPTGTVDGCTIVSGSGSAALDRATCEGAHRLRFDPARDAGDRAIAGSYRLTVRWVLPQD